MKLIIKHKETELTYDENTSDKDRISSIRWSDQALEIHKLIEKAVEQIKLLKD